MLLMPSIVKVEINCLRHQMQRLESLTASLSKVEIGGETKDLFAHVQMAPPDPILGTAVAYRADTDPNKVNLGIGAYRDDSGNPYVFNVVRKVEQEILSDKKLDKVFSSLLRNICPSTDWQVTSQAPKNYSSELIAQF